MKTWGDGKTASADMMSLTTSMHGYTAMCFAPLQAFDLCPRLSRLRERRLTVPKGMEIPDLLAEKLRYFGSHKEAARARTEIENRVTGGLLNDSHKVTVREIALRWRRAAYYPVSSTAHALGLSGVRSSNATNTHL
jgi:hypothetical protein